MSSPGFIGLGAQKCGTSWIFACLADHPSIDAPVKELHFFSKDELFRRGFDWYEDHFTADGRYLSGEFSTTYLHTPRAIERIATRYPQVKLLACLRDPVLRAKSHFLNDKMAGLIEPRVEPDEAFATNPDYIARGCYAEQLRRVFSCFPRDKVMVLVLEDSYQNPQAFISRVYRFLGLPEHTTEFANRRINVGYQPRSVALGKSMDGVASRLRRMGLSRLVHCIRRIGLPEKIRRLNGQTQQAPELNIPLSTENAARLRDDRMDLMKLLDRSFPDWQPI